MAETKSVEVQIAETLRALPVAMREGTTVIGYDESGERTVLKKGSNDMICWADEPDSLDAVGAFYVVCFPSSLEPYQNRRRELSGRADRNSIIDAEVESGKLPFPKLAIRYTLRGASADMAVPLAVMYLPYATGESTGLSTEPDNHRVWLMYPGEYYAHVMLPGH